MDTVSEYTMEGSVLGEIDSRGEVEERPTGRSSSADGRSTMPVLSVIVPAYNEEATIGQVVERLSSMSILKEVVVVDDGSTDGTCQKVQQLRLPNVRLIRQEQNSGKTAAVRLGLREVTGDLTIIQDADLEYDPGEIEDVIRPILENKADVVYGSRFLVKKATRVLYFYHYLGNKMLTFLSDLLLSMMVPPMGPTRKCSGFASPTCGSSDRSRTAGRQQQYDSASGK